MLIHINRHIMKKKIILRLTAKQKRNIFVSQSHVYRYNDICLILHHYNVENITEKNYSAIILRLSASLCLTSILCVYNREQLNLNTSETKAILKDRKMLRSSSKV